MLSYKRLINRCSHILTTSLCISLLMGISVQATSSEATSNQETIKNTASNNSSFGFAPRTDDCFMFTFEDYDWNKYGIHSPTHMSWGYPASSPPTSSYQAVLKYYSKFTAGGPNNKNAVIGNRYVIAMSQSFGAVGDYIDIYTEDGQVLYAILGDVKKVDDDGSTVEQSVSTVWGHWVPTYTPIYTSIIEYVSYPGTGAVTADCKIIDDTLADSSVRSKIKTVINRGSYFNGEPGSVNGMLPYSKTTCDPDTGQFANNTIDLDGIPQVISEWDLTGMSDYVDLTDEFSVPDFGSKDQLTNKENLNLSTLGVATALHNTDDIFSTARAVLSFVGILLMLYGFVLLLAYILDRTNSIVDLRIFSLVTMGKLFVSLDEFDKETKGSTSVGRLVLLIAIVEVVGILLSTGLLVSLCSTLYVLVRGYF